MKLASKVLRIFEWEEMLPIDLIKVLKVHARCYCYCSEV